MTPGRLSVLARITSSINSHTTDWRNHADRHPLPYNSSPLLGPNLRIDVAGRSSGVTRLLLVGELDCSSAPRLRAGVRAALDAGTTTLVLDLAAVSFIDAAGVGVLIGALRQLRERHGSLLLRRLPRPVQRVFEVAGLEELLHGATPAAGPVTASRDCA